MITFTKAYQTSDGETYATLREAQICKLSALLIGINKPSWEEIIESMVINADKVVDILTTKANSKPRARKANGGTRKRKSLEAVAAATNAALQDMKQ